MLHITNDAGQQLLVCCIRKGTRFGLSECLLHEGNDPLIDIGASKHRNFDQRATVQGEFVYRLSIYVQPGGHMAARPLVARQPNERLQTLIQEAACSNAGLARREYKDAVAAFLERLRSRAVAEGFQYSLIVTDTPPERALRNFLLARRR